MRLKQSAGDLDALVACGIGVKTKVPELRLEGSRFACRTMVSLPLHILYLGSCVGFLVFCGLTYSHGLEYLG